MKTLFSSTTNPLLPLLFLFSFTPINGGAWALVPLSYASESVAARICERGAKARERSDRGGGGGGGGWGFPLPHAREIFEIFV